MRKFSDWLKNRVNEQDLTDRFKFNNDDYPCDHESDINDLIKSVASKYRSELFSFLEKLATNKMDQELISVVKKLKDNKGSYSNKMPKHPKEIQDIVIPQADKPSEADIPPGS